MASPVFDHGLRTEHAQVDFSTRSRAWLGSPQLFWAVVVLGVALRTAWAILRTGPALGEASKVAIALANGRGFADAYQAGQGPTAHLLPTVPLFAGGVYAVLGVQTLPAETLLFAVATFFTIGSWVLLARAFGRLGMPRWARLLAIAYLCLLSPYLTDEVASFRIWEGALTCFMTATMLNLIVDLHFDRSARGWRRFVLLAIVGAVTFFVHPLFGAGCYLASAVLVLRRLRPAAWIRVGLVGALALAVLIAPWTVRNALVMGKPIPLRSNAGLELAISMYPGAVSSGPDPKEEFNRRLRRVHPQQSLYAFHHMQKTGGEILYNEGLGNRTKAWMRTHPAEVVWLALRHLRETYVPPVWITSQENAKFLFARTLVADLSGVFGLVGLAMALMRRRSGWIYPAVITLAPGVMFSLFQPIPRYDALFFGLLTFAAAGLLGDVPAQFGRRNSVGPIAVA